LKLFVVFGLPYFSVFYYSCSSLPSSFLEPFILLFSLFKMRFFHIVQKTTGNHNKKKNKFYAVETFQMGGKAFLVCTLRVNTKNSKIN